MLLGAALVAAKFPHQRDEEQLFEEYATEDAAHRGRVTAARWR